MARAFARQASLLILDEPTAHLDARAEYELFTRFKEVSHGRTTLLISHRFTTIALADRIAVLADGRVVELGAHHELLDQRGPTRRSTGCTSGSAPEAPAASWVPHEPEAPARCCASANELR